MSLSAFKVPPPQSCQYLVLWKWNYLRSWVEDLPLSWVLTLHINSGWPGVIHHHQTIIIITTLQFSNRSHVLQTGSFPFSRGNQLTALMEIRHFVNINADNLVSRLLSGQTRKEKLVSSIKYLEYQVQRLINLNCVSKFRCARNTYLHDNCILYTLMIEWDFNLKRSSRLEFQFYIFFYLI